MYLLAVDIDIIADKGITPPCHEKCLFDIYTLTQEAEHPLGYHHASASQ